MCKFWNFRKFTKFLMSFFKPQVSSFSEFASFFSVMIHNSSVLFWLKHNILLTEVAHLITITDLPLLALKFTSCHFWNKELVYLQTLHHSLAWFDITLLYFSSKTFFCFGQKYPIKVQILRLPTARMKINQITYVIVKPRVSFSLNLHHPSVSWHVIPMIFSNWNIMCFE